MQLLSNLSQTKNIFHETRQQDVTDIKKSWKIVEPLLKKHQHDYCIYLLKQN